ncbi:polysaccharide deacetylase family protein [Solimicrobium silvestre]|nr:polysaccharide deacetylase family protein [Solimicrobium silvestre]
MNSSANDAALENKFKEILSNYRKIIVLVADEDKLSKPELDASIRIGQEVFHENQEKIAEVERTLDSFVTSTQTTRFETTNRLLDYVESDNTLFDADRLAFKDVLASLQTSVTKDTSLTAIKMHKRISEDLEALNEIEHNYEKEMGQIFSHFEQRGIVLKREKWDTYVAHLKQLYSREKILKDYGTVLPAAIKTEPVVGVPENSKPEGEIFGNKLPPKTIVLTFDDGPHKQYTEEIAAILKQYDAPAVFFNVGQNLGSVDANGTAKLSPAAKISQKLRDSGYVIGNHSFTHAQLSKLSGDNLHAEIFNTDALLKAMDANRSTLFRFPYGAHNQEGLQALEKAHLKSVMWNIDSLDWADPVPSSIADRVLRTVEKEGRGIILFHDIHDRAVKALPIVLDRLVAEGYQFAGWDGNAFTVAKSDKAPQEKVSVSSGYSNSWAIVIGINDYAKWPKLQYAVQDSQGVRQILIEKLGFPSDHVFSLQNGEATRNGILAMFHDRLANSSVQKDDRIFVFFAGHGATRKLSSGRDLGYIVPVDSDPNEFAADAIPMTEIQNISESLNSKHVFFVMDACYSGLGLTRGGGSSNYLRDNAKRIGRQMLTAGGTDQMVADGGPNGHSVFTWTLLQGLSGKADLNGDGIITATELAAYVAPAVSAVSQQTPAFGSLPGSEGGDFVFELPAETEYINTATTQLSSDAIALNSKLDSTRSEPVIDEKSIKTKSNPVIKVKDLQGTVQTIVTPTAVPVSARQMAQHANDRGLQLYKEKQYAEAESQFTEALKLRPDFALAANNLGFVYYKQEKYVEAARWFENTIKIDPSRAIAYLNFGDAQFHGGDKDKARKGYQTFLELSPNSPSAGYAKQQLEKL